MNRHVKQHDLPFIQTLHVMFVAILTARKLRDQQAPKLFPTVRPQARSAYPYHRLVGPMPSPPPGALGMHPQPHCAHLTMGKGFSGGPSSLAQALQ